MQLSTQDLDIQNHNPLYQTLGITLVEAESGRAGSRLKPNPRVCWPSADQPHGGVLATCLDTTMAWAVLSDLDVSHSCATINLNIEYTRPAKGEALRCQAWITHRTRSLAFCRAEIHDDQDRLVAMGQSTFRVFKRGDNPLTHRTETRPEAGKY